MHLPAQQQKASPGKTNTLFESTREASKVVRLTAAESRVVVAGAWGSGNEEFAVQSV